MKNSILLFCACLVSCLPFLTFAQADYRSGYLITSQGDSLSGFIRVKATAYNPDEISFKPDHNAEVVTYRPDQLRYVHIKGTAVYETYAGTITMDKIDFPDLPTGRDMSTKKDVILLEVLQQGKHVALYAFTDAIKTRLFLKEKGGDVQELSYKQYFVEAEGRKNATKQEYYKTQLWMAAEKLQVGTTKLQSRISRTGYGAKDMAAIIDLINGVDKKKVNEESKGQHDAHLFAGIGAANNRIIFDGTHPLADNPEVKSPLNPKANIGLDIYLSNKVRKLIFRGEVFATKATNTLKSEITRGSLLGNYHYHLEQVLVGVSPQLMYNLYRTPGFRAYTGIGAVIQYHFTSDKKFERGLDGFQTVQMLQVVEKYSVGYPVRVGVILKDKYELSAFYSSSRASGAMGYTTWHSGFSVNLNYHFSSK